MIEKLVANRYLDFQSPAQTANPHVSGFPDHFVEGNSQLLKIGQSSREGFLGTGHRVSQVQAVASAAGVPPHRLFRWLPYIPGKICYLPLDGPDILTGKMSGCWIVVFKHKGTDYIAHIGTEDSPGTANSKAAKKAWQDAVKEAITVVEGYNPVGPDLPAGALAPRTKPIDFYAAIRPPNHFYTVVLSTPGASTANPAAGNTKRKIYGLYAITGTSTVKFLGDS